MMDFINGLLEFYSSGALGAWVAAITLTVTGANAITLLTPTTVDNKIVGAILKVLNFVSLNILRNKNADDAS